MPISGNVSALATRIGQEFKTVRTEFKKTVFLTQAQYDALGTKDPATLYVVTDGNASDVVSATGSGTVTPSYASGSLLDYQATGNVTFNPPTGGVNRRPMRIAVLASGAQRTVTLSTAIRLSTGLSARTFTVPQNQVLFLALEYSTLINAWVLTAATVSVT